MDQHQQRLWYDLHCRCALREKTDSEYQDFFSRVMQMRHGTDFTQVRPWGNLGDRKCDGYITSKKRFFQLYAPNTVSLDKTLSKIDADFNGAIEYWGTHIKEWVFVHNGLTGIAGDVKKALADLKEVHPDKKIYDAGPDWLKEEISVLELSHLAELFGAFPTAQTIQEVRAHDIRKLLNSIKVDAKELDVELPQVPAEKLDYNDFSEEVRDFLQLGRRRERFVEQILEEWPDPMYADRVVDQFRNQYKKLKDDGLTPDEIYVGLQKFAGIYTSDRLTEQAAGYALLSYLFFHCDIFESKPQ